MKKLFVLLAIVFSLTAGAQGIKKGEAKNQSSGDSLIIRGTTRYDTAKTMMIMYVEDGSLIWRKGYAVSRVFQPSDRSLNAAVSNQVFYDLKWVAVKPEDVYDVKQYNWR